MRPRTRLISWLVLALLIGCGQSPAPDTPAAGTHADADANRHGGKGVPGHDPVNAGDHDQIRLSDAQIRAARIEVAPVGTGTGEAVSVPAVIAVDPTRSAIVATSIGGRVRTLLRNVGEPVKAGETLAVLESREAAELSAELQASRQQQLLARSTLRREERLFAERVSPEGDVLAARTAAKEADIRVRLAQNRIGATGAAVSGTSDALAIRSPLQGHIISRSTQLGASVAADAELFRVADLSTVALELSLLPETAPLVQVGRAVTVTAGARSGSGRISFVSPVIDPRTRQVRAMALIPNADGQWRIGETVQAVVPVGKESASKVLTVPKAALQTMEGKPSVFVRNAEGFRVTPIQLGASSGDSVTIMSGLKPGDQIAVTNSFVLKAEAGKGNGDGDDH